MNDFNVAIRRLRSWINVYGNSKPKEFVGDISLLLLAAQEIERLQRERDAAVAKLAQLERADRKLRDAIDEWSGKEASGD